MRMETTSPWRWIGSPLFDAHRILFARKTCRARPEGAHKMLCAGRKSRQPLLERQEFLSSLDGVFFIK